MVTASTATLTEGAEPPETCTWHYLSLHLALSRLERWSVGWIIRLFLSTAPPHCVLPAA